MSDHEQTMQALERANRLRTRRAELKRAIKAGEEPLSPYLLNPPEWLEGAKAGEIIQALRWVGRKRMMGICSLCGFSTNRRIGDLTARQRATLHATLTRLVGTYR